MKVFRNIFLLSLCLIITVGPANAQSSLVKEKHYLNPVLINPATAGSEFHPVLNMSVSKRWLGINDSPSNQVISTSLRLGNFDFYNPKMFLNKTDLKAYEKVGLGIMAYNYSDGPESGKGAQVAYSYHIAFKQSRLSFGLSGVFNSYMLDQSLFNPVLPNDPLIDYSKESINSFNINVGTYYYNSDFFAGISVLNLIPVKDSYKSNYANENREFWFHGGYIFKEMEGIMIEPSVFLNFNNDNNLSYDIFTKLYFFRLNWVALAYHSRNAVSMKTGIRARLFYFTYSYELTLSKIARYNTGTHEIGLGLNIGTRRLEGF